MDIKPAFLLVAALLSTSVQAQVFKCNYGKGRVEYSDVTCAGAVSTGIRNVPSEAVPYDPANDPNARALKMMQADQVRSGPTPAECKFKYFTSGDAKGKILAANAKEECLQNMENKIKGDAVSLDAYSLWRDHYAVTSSKRNAIAAQMNADANAHRTEQKINQATQEINQKLDQNAWNASRRSATQENKTYRCRQSYGDSRELECR